MNINLLYLTFLIIPYLFIINFFLKRYNFCLDRQIFNENHKLLLNKNNLVPLSGSIYFLPIVFFTFYEQFYFFALICSFIFMLGFFADLKIITSYKIRLIIQFILISLLIFTDKEIIVITRISFFDQLMIYEITRILICSFFFMVLINGFNLIDGANCLCSLNVLVVSIFTYLLINSLEIFVFRNQLNILIISLFVFVILNFFKKNFLGDGAAYGLGFLLGYIMLKISLADSYISPYYIAILLLYPAFENLFSIIRRFIAKQNNYLPDNNHMHHLIYKFYKKKKYFKNDTLTNSFTGISINLILFLIYLIGFNYYNHTLIQIILIACFIILYLTVYHLLKQFNVS